MISLFKRHKNIETFAPLGTDMHCHLLPNVDDGSTSVDETVSCLKIMKTLGFKKVLLTPHFQARYPNEENDIQRRFTELKKELKSVDPSTIPEVTSIAGEYRFDPAFERLPEENRVLTLPGKRLLCELSLHNNNYTPIEIFKRYISAGYTLILAHPERYPYLGVHSPEIIKMKDIGMYFQINTLSLNGFYGGAAKDKGFAYINSGMAEYLGTDTHNMRYINALTETANNRQVQKIMESHTFLNSQL